VRLPGGALTNAHPDLALMLSTSGTTGATKLVRLSATAVDANARSIVDYLGIDADERAITTLPPGYSYGLSVINSHLALGWLMIEARTNPRRLLCVAAACLITGFDWGFGSSHNLYLSICCALILFVPRLWLYSRVAEIVAFLAQSTFYIYLCHALVIVILVSKLHINNAALAVIGSGLAGITAMFVWRALLARAAAMKNNSRLFGGKAWKAGLAAESSI
jgi:acyl-CoA synthetase (AMP-forming)/AMP-acid ligase II